MQHFHCTAAAIPTERKCLSMTTANDDRLDSGCSCRLDLAIASVPRQSWEEPQDLETALLHGCLFSSLDMPFFAGGDAYVQ